MERYKIEWEKKGVHEKHLSVLDYKKQERAEEIEQLENKIIDKQTEFETLSKRIQNFDKGTDSLSQMQNALENAPPNISYPGHRALWLQKVIRAKWSSR